MLVNRFFGGTQVPTGRMLHDLAEELANRGWQVRVLTGDAEYAGASSMAGNRHDSSITRLWTARGTTRLLSWSLFWLQAVVLIPFMSWDRCVILTDPPFLVVAARLAKCLNRRRKIFWWTMDLFPEALTAGHVFPSGGLVERFLRQFNEFGLKAVNGVVTLGSMQRRRLETYSHFRGDESFSIVVPPWDQRPLQLQAGRLNRVRPLFKWEGKKVALYAGNLGRGHSYQDLIQAAEILAAEDKSWILGFFCRGAGKPKLRLAAGQLPNVVVEDYVSPELTADLLHSADVHLITMEDGWEGVVVPSKLYGVLGTGIPVLFVGPPDADTANEVLNHGAGEVLPNGCGGRAVVAALNRLAAAAKPPATSLDRKGPGDIASFVVA